MNALRKNVPVGVVGAGAMGAGIAQVAAAAGHPVVLYDVAEGAADDALKKIDRQLTRLVEKGRLDDRERQVTVGRISTTDDLDAFGPAGLVIEAIVEQIEPKRELFQKLETIVADDALLATNTSSISITALAAGLDHPGRVVGMHFFNPAPVMKLVEVISGLATDKAMADATFATARAWGKVAVHARSTPGFIVNRVARPFYGEALRLLEESVADPVTIDALLTEAGGFRMGPFTLMDLIGNDVNYAVSESVFASYHGDPRFRPSLIQKEMVDAGWLGRKSGRGFYAYDEETTPFTPTTLPPRSTAVSLSVDPLGKDPIVIDGVLFAMTDGRTAAERAIAEQRPVLVYDLAFDYGSAKRIAFATSRSVPTDVLHQFLARLSAGGKTATRLPDWPGLIVMRTVAALANEAFDAVLTGVGSETDIDAAMRFGLNYPDGPASWARRIGLTHVLAVIDAIFDATRDPRYRASYGLRRAAAETVGCRGHADRIEDTGA